MMEAQARSLTNEEIIRRFVSGAVPASEFHHADHVRLAFAYLSEYPLLTALEKFSTALKQFATSVGKPNLYNETITYAYLFLIRERMAQCEGADWNEFGRDNPDLLAWKDGILSRYYQPETLKSELARNIFVLPDKSV